MDAAILRQAAWALLLQVRSSWIPGRFESNKSLFLLPGKLMAYTAAAVTLSEICFHPSSTPLGVGSLRFLDRAILNSSFLPEDKDKK